MLDPTFSLKNVGQLFSINVGPTFCEKCCSGFFLQNVDNTNKKYSNIFIIDDQNVKSKE
jgi:hypothetical protein